MAQIVISAAGAAVGFAVGGPAGAQWGWMAGSLLSSLVGGKTQRQSQALIDLKIVGTDYGQTIPYGRGTIPVAGQVWWNSDRQPISNTTTQRQGKGGGQKVETTTITYKVDLLIGLTDIPIVGITRVWDTGTGKLLYHVASDSPVGAMIASGQTTEWDRLTVYTGAADQLPDPTYAAAVGDAPAYRDRGSVFIQGLNLGQSGQMRNLLFEVVIDGAATGIQEREWGGMATTSTWNEAQEIFYDHVRNELWVNNVNGTNGISTTGNVAIYNLTSETWAFLDPPATYGIDVNSNASLASFVATTYNKYYTQIRVPSSFRTTAIYDVDTRSPLATVRSLFPVLYPSDAMISAVDQVNDLILIETDAVKYFLHGSNNGIPAELIEGDIDLGGAGYYAVADVNGNFWVNMGSSIVKTISAQGAVSTIDLSPLAPEVGHNSGTWVYDSSRNGIYFFSTHDNHAFLYRLDCSTGTASAVNPVAFDTADVTQADNWTDSIAGYDPDADRILLKRGYGGGGTTDFRIGYLDPDTGVTQEVWPISGDATDWGGGNVPAYRGFAWGLNRYDPDAPAIGGIGEVRFSAVGDDPPTVEEVVSDLCLRSGLSAGQFDATALSTITRKVKCMPVAQISSAASVIDTLAGSYFFDLCCDDKIRFFPRGGSVVATIPFEELGAEEPGARNSTTDVFPLQERSDIEIPAQVLVSYANIDKDYETDTQPSDRLVSTLENTVEDVNLPLGFTPSEGKLVADASLLDQAASRWTAPISLLGHYARIQPGDPIVVTTQDGSTLRMRSVRMRDAYPIMRHDLVLDEPSALESVGLTALDYTSSTNVAGPITTSLQLLDIPILRDVDDDSGLYVATKPTTGTTFPGAAIFDSADNSAFVRQATVLESAVFGSCTTVLGDWDGPRVFDERNTVTVNVGDGTLSSSTRALVLNNRETNAALIGSEIVQFTTATLVSSGVYRLSGLLRGCRGTEWAIGTHAAFDRFVLLREAGIRRIPVENSSLGLSRYYKAVTLGRALSSASSQEYAPMAVGLKPFAPVDLRGSRDGSNNVTITWQRRSRMTVRAIGALGIGVPLGEDTESYSVEILDDASDASVLRTLSATSPSVAYTAAQQTADGITPGDPIEVRVYQISAVVGRGYVLQGVV